MTTKLKEFDNLTEECWIEEFEPQGKMGELVFSENHGLVPYLLYITVPSMHFIEKFSGSKCMIDLTRITSLSALG